MKICVRLYTSQNYGNCCTDDIQITNNLITVEKLKTLLFQKYQINPSQQKLTVKIAQKLVTMTNEWPLSFFYIKENSTIYVDYIQKISKTDEIKLKKNNKSTTKYMNQLSLMKQSYQQKLDIIKESPNECNEQLFKQFISTMTSESFIELLTTAVKNNNIFQLKELIDQHKQYDVNTLNKSGWNALHYACYYGYADIVNELARNQKCDPNFLNQQGYTPLHLASFKGHSNVTTILVALDNIQINIETNGVGTPLHCACKKNHFKIVSILLHKANPK